MKNNYISYKKHNLSAEIYIFAYQADKDIIQNPKKNIATLINSILLHP